MWLLSSPATRLTVLFAIGARVVVRTHDDKSYELACVAAHLVCCEVIHHVVNLQLGWSSP